MMTVCNYNYCTHTVSRRIWINPYFTQIRLSGGATVNQGLVDVYFTRLLHDRCEGVATPDCMNANNHPC